MSDLPTGPWQDRHRGHGSRLWRDGTSRCCKRSPETPGHSRAGRARSKRRARPRINYIDTSIDYGTSEEFIGEYLSDRRGEYFLASKCGCLVGAAPVAPDQRQPHVFTKENIVAGVEQSLRRMKTDYLDVVQLHSSPSMATLQSDDVIATLLELKATARSASSARPRRSRTSPSTSHSTSSTSSRFPTRPSPEITRP